MVSIRDVKDPRQGQDEFLGYEIQITNHETGEDIRIIKSQTPIPVPSIGEDVLLSTLTIAAEDGNGEWAGEEILPEETLYVVERVGYEYMFLELAEGARDGYREGFILRTHIRVVERESE